MKLLIADDEELTRSGLLATIDWPTLGINEILQADDGLRALKLARIHEPDIILCDVRMPQMNGIEVIHEIKKFLPNIGVIFMSGYSDKEYLKAAIKLRAVNYIEKPLNPSEIYDAILEAKKYYLKLQESQRNEKLYSFETSSRLAGLLTHSWKENEHELNLLCKELSLSLTDTKNFFTTWIIRLELPLSNPSTINMLRTNLDTFLSHYHMKSFYVQLHTAYHIFHILSPTHPSTIMLSTIQEKIGYLFSSLGQYYISYGTTVRGITHAYDSYLDATIAMQHSFFFPSNTVFPINETKTIKTTLFSDTELSEILSTFSDSLLSKNYKKCEDVLSKIYNFYYCNLTLLPAHAKAFYYKLFVKLEECRIKLKISYDSSFKVNNTLEQIEKCFSLSLLHSMLEREIEHFFNQIKYSTQDDSTIFLIKDYISHHYRDETLSIKDIAEHVFLSAPYVCTYFKNQTGKTLNQYLTDYRMEKAIELLQDSRYQIIDISSKVGYSNGNYFGKSFKKYTGMTPSKYREKLLK